MDITRLNLKVFDYQGILVLVIFHFPKTTTSKNYLFKDTNLVEEDCHTK